jgi:hypothetical protein
MPSLRVVSFSELSTARQCPLKHELSYVERWSRPQPANSALYKGTYWHKALEAHYTEIRRAQQAKEKPDLDACRFAVEQAIDRADPEIAELIWWMYQGHVDLYGTDDSWRILAVEHSANVALPTPRGNNSRFVLKIKIDLIVRDLSTRTRNVLVVDHKSGKDLPNSKILELDDQFGLYTWGVQRLGHKVFGQLYNAARTLRTQADLKDPGTQPLDERFRRIPMYRTAKELEQTAIEAYLTASARYRQQAEMKRQGLHSPRHTDPQVCAWKCDFLEPCMASRKGMDLNRFLRDSGFTVDRTRH